MAVPEVRYAEPVYKREFIGFKSEIMDEHRVDPDDAQYITQTHLPFMKLDQAWDVMKGQDGSAIIGIVDGGTDWRHEDLQANIWVNPNEVDGDGIDNDGNGHVDDIHGWNFTDDKPDPTGPANSLSHDHGTAVAGTAAAVTNNGTGIAGAGWNARFMAVNTSCSDQDGACFYLQGTLYAALNGADVITASYGGPNYLGTDEMVYMSATAEGALVVGAAGNRKIDVDYVPEYPAHYATVMSVGGYR